MRPARVTVLVLGDIGRSPRMQNHALALAENGFEVDLVGYKAAGAKPPETLLSSSRINLHYLQEPWRPSPGSARLWYLLNAPVKVTYQVLQLFWLLAVILAAPDFLLIQNPPAIPTLLVAQAVCWLRGIRLLIDWHNFGYTILALTLGRKHPLVYVAKLYEWYLGRYAYAHLCVTQAMAARLKLRWRVSGQLVVLYDKPPTHFRRLSLKEAHQFWCDLTANNRAFKLASAAFGGHSLPQQTLLTELVNGKPQWRPNRPQVLVSSTSWTPDEDFGILLKAAQQYDQECRRRSQGDRPPNLLILITGRGPQRAYYESVITDLALKHVCLVTLWLAAEDYPRLLGAADLGISLHQSSSGMDLPMKVVDMFGCGLPVCALDFACLDELVQHQVNGWVFHSSNDLVTQWLELFSAAPIADCIENPLSRARRQLLGYQSTRWPTYWRTQALDLFMPTD
ncbi:mannosyltransferase [Dimargaris verticillata]|uniref:Chitobiosyldiphosphodolichol beta-mannosyltransferase n=1 Tax=Dimargaris verticillata TaxID=2761393 RepID=A0A9W8B347_9FUNG|nr:mannosyltransferase [Dimargaris verticillata]